MDVKKEEESFNLSQASSCDYSMSQFRSDEPAFVAKQEATYNEDDSALNDDDDNDNDNDNDNDDVDDDEDMPLAMRKRKHEPIDELDGPEDDDDIPLLARKKIKKESKEKKNKKKRVKEELDSYSSDKVNKKKIKKVSRETKINRPKGSEREKKICKHCEKQIWICCRRMKSNRRMYHPQNLRARAKRKKRRKFGDGE